MVASDRAVASEFPAAEAEADAASLRELAAHDDGLL